MLKKTNRTLFAALITLSLIGQGATAIASGCSAGHAASADRGTGSEVMSRLATPMVGGMISAVLLTLLILPAVYYLWRR